MKRTIIFGDVHGCVDEWNELLVKVGAGPDDDLISVGDIIGKGPDSGGALELALGLPNLRAVLGNHEVRILRYWSEDRPPTTPWDIAAVDSMGERFPDMMSAVAEWPYFIEASDYLVVHAGLRDGVSLEEQSADDLTRIRELSPGGPAWYERYTDERLVVFGHWAVAGLVVRPNAIGLDTGCVYGGELSAVILPEREIVSVPARRQYVDPLAPRPKIR